jgi:hypothetical protein
LLSNPESFIEEVTEELRRDRMFAAMRKYGWIAVTLVLVVVGGAAWNEWQKATARTSAENFGNAVVAAIDLDGSVARIAAFEALSATELQAGVVNLLIAAEAAQADDRPAALVALQAVANNAALPQSYRQVALLKWVIVGGADIPLAEREVALMGLSEPGQAFRPLALEQVALLRIEDGLPDAALVILSDLLNEPDVTEALRRRVSQLIVALGGTLDAA